MKKLPSEVAQNRPNFFFSNGLGCPYGQKLKIYIGNWAEASSVISNLCSSPISKDISGSIYICCMYTVMLVAFFCSIFITIRKYKKHKFQNRWSVKVTSPRISSKFITGARKPEMKNANLDKRSSTEHWNERKPGN